MEPFYYPPNPGNLVLSVFLTHPWMLLSLSAVALLAVLYWWHCHSRQRRISAMFLWDKPEISPESGSRWLVRKLPASFYWEAAALLLLSISAAMPFFLGRKELPVMVVILDNSFSMQATFQADSTIHDELQYTLGRLPHSRTIWYLAGREPHLLADTEEPFDYQSAWLANEDRAELLQTLAQARKYCPGAKYLIVTDRQPDFTLSEDTGCLALGEPRPNLAIINARRSDTQLLVEIANYSDAPADAALTLSPGDTTESLALQPHEQRKLTLRLSPDLIDQVVTIKLDAPNDALPYDNLVTLAAAPRLPLRFAFSPELSESARSLLQQTFKNSVDFQMDLHPELLFTSQQQDGFPACHRLFWHVPDQSQASFSTMPIVALGNPPLLQGLDLSELRWPADHSLAMPGIRLIIQGDTTLLSQVKRHDGFMDIHLNLYPQAGNPHLLPFWPAFFWNLSAILRQERQGPRRANWNAGEYIQFHITDKDVNHVTITGDNLTRSLPVLRRTALSEPLPAGLYTATAGDHTWRFAVATLSPFESNLAGANTLHKGITSVQFFSQTPRHNLAWLFALLAIFALLVHQKHLMK